MSKKEAKSNKAGKGQKGVKVQVDSPSRNETCERELERLRVEPSHLQSWVKASGARIIVFMR